MISRRSLLAAAWAAPGLAAAQEEGPALPPPLGDLAELPLTDPGGFATTLGAEIVSGAASIVTFWATWCPPCVPEARHLAGIRRAIPAERLNILGLNIDRGRDPERIDSFLGRARVNYPWLFASHPVYRAFGGGEQIALPRLFVFYPDGRPLTAFGRYSGDATLARIDQALARAIG